MLDELATGRLTAVEAVDRALTHIARDDLGAWLTLDPAHARRQAHEIDAFRASGERERIGRRRTGRNYFVGAGSVTFIDARYDDPVDRF